jgi:adenylate cyclase
LAWLFRGVAYTFFDRPDEAMQSSERALLLAPLDPLRYYFESLAASSALCAGNYVRAIELCAQSLKRNRAHAHTYRALITAYALSGSEELARSTAQKLMALAPDTTVSKFRANSASAKVKFGKMIAECMLHAGIPS